MQRPAEKPGIVKGRSPLTLFRTRRRTPERMKPFRVLHAEKTRKSGGLPLSWHANAPAERTAGAFVKPDALHFRYDTNFAEDRNFVIFAFERLYDADNHDDEPGDQADDAH